MTVKEIHRRRTVRPNYARFGRLGLDALYALGRLDITLHTIGSLRSVPSVCSKRILGRHQPLVGIPFQFRRPIRSLRGEYGIGASCVARVVAEIILSFILRLFLLHTLPSESSHRFGALSYRTNRANRIFSRLPRRQFVVLFVEKIETGIIESRLGQRIPTERIVFSAERIILSAEARNRILRRRFRKRRIVIAAEYIGIGHREAIAIAKRRLFRLLFRAANEGFFLLPLFLFGLFGKSLHAVGKRRNCRAVAREQISVGTGIQTVQSAVEPKARAPVSIGNTPIGEIRFLFLFRFGRESRRRISQGIGIARKWIRPLFLLFLFRIKEGIFPSLRGKLFPVPNPVRR